MIFVSVFSHKGLWEYVVRHYGGKISLWLKSTTLTAYPTSV